ncbi:cytochrome P450 76T24 [Cryptomeria japonica]|uniref:cytochrome P450 76T24 n=1 Tax=Cryptomeria japonica TaxID=3369 RepID=UPI0027DA7613|nr:cytochrome P450 76T24 [Cryptomeria japonica]
MDIPLFSWYSVLLTSASLLFFFFLWRRERRTGRPLPPGPPGWPIVGNLFQLGKRPHESLYALSLKYGPLMTLRLGMKTTVVVSSPAMAKEVLKTHDLLFAGRTVIEGVKSVSHHKSSLIFSDYGAQWRHLRRISTVELFSSIRQEALQHLRRDEVFHTIRLLYDDKGKVVDIGRTVFCTSLNLLGNMIFSTRVFDPHNPASAAFNHSVCELMRLGGKPNLVDYFPFLRFLDPQGVCRQMAKHFKEMYDFVDLFLQKRLASGSESLRQNDSTKDFLDVLLDFRSQEFTLVDIRALIAEFFIAGTETTTSTVEWAMAEFIRNPQKLNRARQELDEVVGCNRRVEESDLDRLPYLHAAVKEIFRLHTPVPLLLPHKAESASVVQGFVIPKDSQVLVNVWASGRDPSIWKRPSEFLPERFLEGENSKIDYKGQNFELIPFGAGRRICAALPLASRMVQLILASLLHSFEWMLPDGMSCEEMDMSDELGITLKKSVELTAIPVPRLSHHTYEQ